MKWGLGIVGVVTEPRNILRYILIDETGKELTE